MDFEVSKKFEKQVYKIRDHIVKKRLQVIIDKIASVETLDNFPNITPIVNHPGYYRIKFGDYRIGISLEGDTIWFLFFGKRDESTYKKFLK